MSAQLSRREFLQAGGALVIGLGFAGATRAQIIASLSTVARSISARACASPSGRWRPKSSASRSIASR